MTPVHIKLEEVRQRKGVTKAHIARHCGHSVAWYHDIATGRRNLSVSALLKISEALEVPASIFFDSEVRETLIRK